MLEVLPYLLIFISAAIASKKGLAGFLGFSPVLLILAAYFGTQGISQDPNFYVNQVKNWLPPVLTLITGLLVGLQASQQEARLESAKEREMEVEEKASLLVKRIENLQDQKIQLEKKILKDDTFVLKMQEAALSLRGFDEDRIIDQLLRLLQEFLPCQSLSYYSYNQDTFVLKNGFHAKDRCPAILEPDSKLHTALLSQGATISVREHSYLALENVILACPLQLESKLGAILVHQMEFSDLVRSNVILLESLCQWGSHAIMDARSVNAQTSSSIQYFSSAFNSFFFKHMLERELRLSRRYNTFCTLLTMRIHNVEELIDSEGFFSLITHQLAEVYRNVDSLFFNEIKGDRFHILLPMTEEENSHIAAGKLDHRLEKLQYRPYQDPEMDLEYSVNIFHMAKHTSDGEYEEYLKSNGLDQLQS